jgi:adenine phosphoribosyltransferase
MAEPVINLQPTHVLGLESRGFIFGSALAQKLGLGFVPARKAGKLPGATFSQALEGGGTPEALEIPQDAFKAGDRVLIVDDALATGRTAAAARALVERSGAHPVALTLFMELELQQGRNRLEGMPVFSLVRFSDAAPGLAHQA